MSRSLSLHDLENHNSPTTTKPTTNATPAPNQLTAGSSIPKLVLPPLSIPQQAPPSMSHQALSSSPTKRTRRHQSTSTTPEAKTPVVVDSSSSAVDPVHELLTPERAELHACYTFPDPSSRAEPGDLWKPRATQIVRRVWISDHFTATSPAVLLCLGVTHILNAAPELGVIEYPFPFRFRTHALPYDASTMDPTGHFGALRLWVNGVLAKSPKTVVLIHSKEGRSRAVALGLAFMLSKQIWSFDEAWKNMTDVRPLSQLAPGTRKALSEYSRKLKTNYSVGIMLSGLITYHRNVFGSSYQFGENLIDFQSPPEQDEWVDALQQQTLEDLRHERGRRAARPTIALPNLPDPPMRPRRRLAPVRVSQRPPPPTGTPRPPPIEETEYFSANETLDGSDTIMDDEEDQTIPPPTKEVVLVHEAFIPYVVERKNRVCTVPAHRNKCVDKPAIPYQDKCRFVFRKDLLY